MWEQVEANRKKTTLLIVCMALLLISVGFFCGIYVGSEAVCTFIPAENKKFVSCVNYGLFGVFAAFIVWAIQSLIALYAGDQIILSLMGAKEVKEEHDKRLHNIVDEMVIASGLGKKPTIYVIDDHRPNAFAVGRGQNNASVAVTTGLLEIMNRDELQGVIAHEIAHIQNEDVLLMTMMANTIGTIVLLSEITVRVMRFSGSSRRSNSKDGGGAIVLIFVVVGLLLMVLSPIIARLIYFAASRNREYLADACAALYTRYPSGLASALAKIHSFSHGNTQVMSKESSVEDEEQKINQMVAPMFIVNPLQRETKNFKGSPFDSHPPLGARIEILNSFGNGTVSLEKYNENFRRVVDSSSSIISVKSSSELKETEQREPSQNEDDPITKKRSVNDLIWNASGFTQYECSCGTKLKIPKAKAQSKLNCPHCLKPVDLSGYFPGGNPLSL
jgi:heat shock protein HtpX